MGDETSGDNKNCCRRYEALEKWCRSFFTSGKWLDTDMNGKPLFNEIVANESRNAGYPIESVLSLLRNMHVRDVKRSHHSIMSKGKLFVDRFQKGKSLLAIAREFNYPPYLIVKVVIDQLGDSIPKQNKDILNQIMNDPWHNPFCSLLQKPADITTEARLFADVLEAVRADPIDGPLHSRECNMIGMEYEIRLQTRLKEMDIPFETENELRIKGTAKTPDILLSMPLGIRVRKKNNTMEWKTIFWIDSKALFGDVKTHEQSVLPQADKYVHRFGPGLILYWFGHAPLSILREVNDVIIAAWDLPRYFMLPTGDFIGRGTVQLSSYLMYPPTEEDMYTIQEMNT